MSSANTDLVFNTNSFLVKSPATFTGTLTSASPPSFSGVTADNTKDRILAVDSVTGSLFYRTDVVDTADLAPINVHIASQAAHGVLGQIVGTNSTQALVNKTISLTTAGGTPATLDYYEQGILPSVGFTGAFTGSVTIPYERIGRNICLSIPSFLAAKGPNGILTSVPLAIPTKLRPLADVQFAVPVQTAGAPLSTYGCLKIAAATGIITIGVNANFGDFSGGGTCGILPCALNYSFQ